MRLCLTRWQVGGKKFDMRIFALCLSFSPLKVYLYREGFCRFSNARFSVAKKDLANAGMHLTNHAVQKKDDRYSAVQTDLKWPIKSLKVRLPSMSGKCRCSGRGRGGAPTAPFNWVCESKTI